MPSRPTKEPRSAPPHGSDRLAGLDLLRFVAAMAVVVFHFGYAGTVSHPPQTTIAFPEISGFARYGFLGVDLFFIVSGFVIAATAEGRDWLRFAIARAGRLYPAFFVCMTATAVIIALAGMPPHEVTLNKWLLNLTMWAPRLGQPHMDGVYWTIVLELVFYGWMALLIAVGLWQRRPVAVVTVWLAICFVAETLLDTTALRTILLTEYGAFFASGILIHRIHRGVAGLWEWMLLGFAISLGLQHAIDMRSHFAIHYATDLSLGILWTLHIGLYVVFAAALWLSRVMPPIPLVVAMGGLTYPLYLLHQVIGFIALEHLTAHIGRWLAMALILPMLLLASWLVWRFIEPVGRRHLVALLEMTAARLARFLQAGRLAPR